jgi:hypothetical protein
MAVIENETPEQAEPTAEETAKAEEAEQKQSAETVDAIQSIMDGKSDTDTPSGDDATPSDVPSKEDDKGEETPPKEPEPTPDVDESGQAGEPIAEETLAQGVNLGLDTGYLKYVHETQGAAMVQDLMNRAATAQAQYNVSTDGAPDEPAAEPEPDTADEFPFKEEDFDPEMWQFVKQQWETNQALKTEISEIKKTTVDTQEREQKQKMEAMAQQFDKLSGDTDAELLGTGSWKSLAPDSDQFQNRHKLLQKLEIVTFSEPTAPFEERFKDAMYLAFPDHQRKQIQAETTDKIRKSPTMTPTGKNGNFDASPEAREKDVVNKIQAIMDGK